MAQLIARVPQPKNEQAQKFREWYEKDQGVEIDLEEARARLHHLNELFPLLGGPEWLNNKEMAKKQAS